jgi:hypothetical protein
MCYSHPPPSELPWLFWQLSLVYPFGARRISLINPLLHVSTGESHLMVCFPPMGGARCRSMSILHVKPTRPAYVPICVSFCQVRLERGIHPCSCWRYKRHWRAIDKWGDASKPYQNLLCKRSASATTSMASCATSTKSTLLATSTPSTSVVYALCCSCKRLLPHVLDWGNLKLHVGGRGVFRERHCRHLLLDSHLIGCQLVDCCVDISNGIGVAPPYVLPRVLPIMCAAVCVTVVASSAVSVSSSLSLSANTLNMFVPPCEYSCCPVVIRRARD